MLDALCAHLVFASGADAWDEGRGVPPRRGDDVRAHPSLKAAAEVPLEPLLQQLRAADETVARAALEQLFQSHYTPLCNFAAQYVGAIELAEEVVEDVFTRVWVSRMTWTPRETVAGYLYGAVRYAALNALRTVKSERERYDRITRGESWYDEAVEDAQEHAEHLRTMIWKAVASLPEPQKLVIILRWQRGLAWPEVAEVLGTTVGAAQMHQSRALRTLRQRLPKYLR